MKKLFAVIICAVLSVNILAGYVAAFVPDEENANTRTQEFVFNPKVSSVACPDQETYDWVMGQFPDRCFPVLTQLIEPDMNMTMIRLKNSRKSLSITFPATVS